MYVDYTDPIGLKFNLPANADPAVIKLVRKYESQALADASTAVQLLKKLKNVGEDVLVYPDAEAWIERQLTQSKLKTFCDEIRSDPENHPLRTKLLNATLLPYQLDGIAFAVGAGRAILADDMGLGKTIQGIGIAELLARQVGIGKVLVVCPASLKSQWQQEIHRFSGRSAQLVLGRAEERHEQYRSDCFFTICNYEQVLRDEAAIGAIEWDLILLDEGQRIKNWESKTSQLIRSLHSRYAVVLSGTPLENRLDELYTVCNFVDDQRLGPAYEFFHRHRIVSETGRVEGFQNLDDVRAKLKPILLRRTRDQVIGELPERTTSVIKIRPTQEQADIHTGAMQNVVRITSKRFLTEMDLLQLQKYLLICRMSADSSFLVDKQEPGYSTKLDRIEELLGELAELPDRKVIIFSEWRRMLDLIEPLLEAVEMDFVRLDGQVPQKKRAAIVNSFQTDPECRVILMSNAGSTGLNLQAANTVINVDLPWNPAVLEQRIARAHRMGQKNPVHVYLLVTEDTIEEKLLDTLAMKQDLALAALDADSEVNEVMLESGMEELRRRLEQLLGKQPDAPIDESQLRQVSEHATELSQRRERVAAAGAQLVSAALQMVGELISDQGQPDPDPNVVSRLHQSLSNCIERDGDGKPQLRITLESDSALNSLAQTLARLLVHGD